MQKATKPTARVSRRNFLIASALAGTGVALGLPAAARAESGPKVLTVDNLPRGNSPEPVSFPHFPDALHAFVWRNWQLVPCERMAHAIGAKKAEVERLGRAMGLPRQTSISADQWRRSALTIIKRNWHLLPYEQLLDLLGWTAEQMEFALREDDFLFVKLGNLKPACRRLMYSPPDPRTQARQAEIAKIALGEFSPGRSDPLFSFVSGLSKRPSKRPQLLAPAQGFAPRYCYSYFALYGDPLLETDLDPYPDGYLEQLAACGVNGVWLQGVLTKLAPFPWDPNRSENYPTRLENLQKLVRRAGRHGIGVYLYLNEPRALPISFFASHPHLKGVAEGDYATLCTSVPEVRDYLKDAIATVVGSAPGLAGVFTITASENLTSCWSHYQGKACPRCSQRNPGEVIAEVNGTLHQGLVQAGAKTRLIAWDWGWQEAWAEAAIQALPTGVAVQSVSEWDLPIQRGGVKSNVGEYSISSIGPGPRAPRHWKSARARGLNTIAKIQAGNTWELSAVPYIPAVENVAQHAANLRAQGVDGLMLGWTLGGYPSPNLEVVAEIGRDANVTVQEAMLRVASRRYGGLIAGDVVEAWKLYSAAFREFPFGSGLYSGPMQLGPANLLWLQPTGYDATMVGFPYDDLKNWSGNYPAEVFASQLQKVADGFYRALERLKADSARTVFNRDQETAFKGELSVGEAAALHFHSAALQCRFIMGRKSVSGPTKDQAQLNDLRSILFTEIKLARQLLNLQRRDARLGFEASNQYYYIPLDLLEKILNCQQLLKQMI